MAYRFIKMPIKIEVGSEKYYKLATCAVAKQLYDSIWLYCAHDFDEYDRRVFQFHESRIKRRMRLMPGSIDQALEAVSELEESASCLCTFFKEKHYVNCYNISMRRLHEITPALMLLL